MDILETLIPIMAVLAMAFACSMLKEKGSFSLNVFLCATSIGIAILIWIPLVPVYLIIISILITVGMFFSNQNKTVGAISE